MSKELAQTVGGRKFAWLIAILAAFAVAAALGTRWQTSSATVTAADWQITGPWLNNNCTGPAGPNFTGTLTVYYCIESVNNPLTGTYLLPIVVTITQVDPDISFTGVTNIVAGGPAACSGSGASVTCTFGPLPPPSGPPYRVAFEATVNGDTPAGNGSVTGFVDDGDPGQPPVPPATNSVQPLNQVLAPSLTKTVAPPSVPPSGGTVTWTITVNNSANQAPDDATVNLVDTLPAGLTYGTPTFANWATTPTCTLVGNILTCTGGVVSAGTANATITITATVPANPGGATFPNTVSGTATVAGFPFNLGPATATLTQNAADPTVTKAFNPGYVSAAGGTVQVTIQVTNPAGSGFNASINLTDNLPSGLTRTGSFTYGGWATNPTCSGTTTITCTGGSLAQGATGTISFNVTVPSVPAGARYNNTVSGTITIGTAPFAVSGNATLWQGVYLVHIADDGSVITQSEVNNNVRGSRHEVCVVAGDPANPVGVTLTAFNLSNLVITNGGGYASTTDTDPTVTDLVTSTRTIGGQTATCFSWRSLDAGDQTISLVGVTYTPPGGTVTTGSILGPGGTGLVKEWNRLEDSFVTLSGGATGSAIGNSTTTPVISRTLPVTLNPLTGLYQGATVTITDVFRGSHTNSAGVKEGPMPLAGVDWTVDRAPGSSTCGSLGGTLSGTTTLTSTANPAGPNTHNVGNQPNFTFSPNGCAPGQRVVIRIRGTEPGAFGSGTGATVTQLIEFNFVTAIPAKHIFLAWAGQRVVLEHNWAIDPSTPATSAATCPAQTGTVTYIRQANSPGNFIPGGTVFQILGNDEATAAFQASSGTYPCISVAVYESEDQGQVDVEAFITNAPASKVAWVVYYMKIENVGLSLATQVSKPTHNGSAAPDWAPGNPWDASKDDADGAAEWNVSKDILVRGRVSGWFVNSNPSGRPADTSNPLNVRPANRWVMPNDWPLLAGGPDGEEAFGTAEQFRPYFDIMIAPNNALGRALASTSGLGFNVVAAVAAGNTGVGSAASPVRVTTCASLQPGDLIYFGSPTPPGSTVASCTGTSLVLSAPLATAPAAGTPIFEASGTPFIGPYSALDIVGLSQEGFGTTAPSTLSPFVRDTAWKDFDVDWWDAPMPPAMVSVAIRGTGFIKQVLKSDVYYLGTPNSAAQTYPNPYYWSEIPESPFISAVAAGGGYLWDSWGTNGPVMGPYQFWVPVRIGVNSAGIGEALSSADITELGIIRTAYGDTTIARDLVVFSDNHGEFMVAANGDFKTDLSACATNALAGGKHCKPGDKVGRGTIVATADYPDFRGRHFPVASNAVTVDWTWGGYKDVTIEKGETDQFVYVVFHALDRDGFCSVPTGAVSLHPVLSSADAGNDFSSLGLRYNGDPVENVDFLIDSGEGIIIAQSGGGTINDGRRFATGVTTYSVAANDPAVSGIKEFPLSPLAAQGQTDECQAWIKVSNSLLGIVNVLVIAKDDEGNIGFDRVIDLQTTTSYTLNFRWSLITWAGANNIPVMDAIKGTGKNEAGNDISASVTAIYGWDAAGQKWLGFFPAGVNVPGANDLTALKTGEAYWIAITGPSSVTWTIATNVD